MQLKPGTTLCGGKYKIERVLGQGGFGITYLAVQTGLNRRVAVKEFFMKELCNRDETTSMVSVPSIGSRELVGRFRQKFLKEAQTIAAFDHPNIVRIYDIFEENGTAYYVMENIDGGSLADQQMPMSEAKAVGYIRQVGNALAYIHSQNVLHLDVKPSNILLRRNGDAVLIDFGISKRYDDEGGQTSSTPAGLSKGYAPLEQYNQGLQTFSPATDVYSLGATLYKLVTGQTPPEASIVNEEGLPDHPANVSAAVWNTITKAMQPRRKDRPQTADDFLQMLDNTSAENNDESTVVSGMTWEEKSAKIQKPKTKQSVQAQDFGHKLETKGKMLPRTIWYGVAAVVVLILGLSAWIGWENSRSKVAFYYDYVNVWGMPTGLDELSRSDAQHRNGTYMFYMHRAPMGHPKAWQWITDSLVYVDADLKPLSTNSAIWNLPYTKQTIDYDATTGNATAIHYFDRKGTALYTANIEILDFDKGYTCATWQKEGEVNLPRIGYVWFEHDEKGYVSQQIYCKDKESYCGNLTICDDDGAYRRQFTRDGAGHVVRVDFISKDEVKRGTAAKEYEYDRHGRVIKTTLYDAEGNVAAGADYWASVKTEHDGYGRITERRYFDSDGNACYHNKQYHAIRWKYDDSGRMTEVAYYDASGNPCYNSDGESIVRYAYDQHGFTSEITVFDTAGKPCFPKTWDARTTIKNDADGNGVYTSFFAPDGKPCFCDLGYAADSCRYDERGNWTQRFYFDTNGRPCLSNNGIASWTKDLDEYGQMTAIYYFNLENKPSNTAYGYAVMNRKYDANGNITEEAFYNTHSRVKSKEGYARVEYLRDASGNVLEVRFYDTNDNPCNNVYGYAMYHNQLNIHGNITEQTFYDLGGKPTNNQDGSYCTKYVYDKHGRVVEESYYDTNLQPSNCTDGYHKAKYEYDERGNRIRGRFYDVNGSSMNCSRGFAAWSRNYDERNNQVSRQFYDTANNPCTIFGYSKVESLFNERYQEIETRYYVDDKLTNNLSGYAVVKYECNERGYDSVRSFFGPDGSPAKDEQGVSVWKQTYNATGGIEQWEAYDTNGKLLASGKY